MRHTASKSNSLTWLVSCDVLSDLTLYHVNIFAVCDKGYYLDADKCTICAQGEYKDTVSDDTTCRQCSAVKAGSSTADTTKTIPATDASFCGMP